MDIDRKVKQGGLELALHRIGFCLDKIEEQGLSSDFSFVTRITERLTLEEIIGALVSAEQELKVFEAELNKEED